MEIIVLLLGIFAVGTMSRLVVVIISLLEMKKRKRAFDKQRNLLDQNFRKFWDDDSFL